MEQDRIFPLDAPNFTLSSADRSPTVLTTRADGGVWLYSVSRSINGADCGTDENHENNENGGSVAA
jgi:hypothetical protein